MTNEDSRPPEFVQSLDRGLAVIRAFSDAGPRLNLTEVATATNLTRATARRFLITLEHLGYVATDERQFFLRPKVLELGYAYLSSMSQWSLASTHLEDLVAQVQESSSISILEGSNIMYVARIPTKRIMTINLSIGTRLPAHATSMGHVLLSALDEHELDAWLDDADLEVFTSETITEPERLRHRLDRVREQGWAIADRELENGVRSIAVPLHNSKDEVIAAVNVSANAGRVPISVLQNTFLPHLQAAAERIDKDLSMLPGN